MIKRDIIYSERSKLMQIYRDLKSVKKSQKKPNIIFRILFIQYLLLSANIILLLKKKLGNKNFKNIDVFFIDKIKKSYQGVSDYLNNKFFVNKNGTKIPLTWKKKTIKIYFEDLYNRNYREKWIKDELGDKFNIIFDSENPDYLFFNVFNCSHLKPKYKNAIKIAHFTENQIVDLNVADYAIGQHHINFLDRYYRRPFFIFQLINYKNRDFNIIRKAVLYGPKRTKFCAAVISNNYWTDGFRNIFYKELNKYKEIGMGGMYQNNVGGCVSDKIKFLREYKFSLAMENTKADGYITEKIIDAFIAGNIPIYYGDYMVEEYINPKSFILIKGEKDMMEKIEYIKKIDNDDELYRSILREKVLINDNIKEESTQERIKFLTHIFEQDKRLAKRVDNYH